MSDAFVPLAAFLRSSGAQPLESDVYEPQPLPAAEPPADNEDALREARRFRAGLADAIDAALPQLLQGIARDVLARELRLEGAEIAAVVESAIDGCGTGVLRVCVHPSEMTALGGLEVERVSDEALRPGDVRIELRSGTIDLSLDARLDAVLRAWT